MMTLSIRALAEDEWHWDRSIQPYSLEEDEEAALKGKVNPLPLVVKFPNGLIVDWKKGVIVVRGQEFITGKTTPQNKNLIEAGAAYNAKIKMNNLIDEFRIDRTRRLADLFEGSYKLKARIKDLIMSRSKVIHRKYWEGKKILEVTITLKMFGKDSLSEALYWSLFYWENPWDKYYPAYKPPTSESYTGLIIDARGLDVEPAFLPRIVNESEESLYRDKYVKYDIVVNEGLVLYLDDIDNAILNQRIGRNPLIVKAITKVKSAYRTDVILGEEDEKKLKEADKQGKFLKYLRAVIVI